MLFKKKRKPTNEERHNYDAKATKIPTQIEWLCSDTSWSASPYYIPDEFAKFNNSIGELAESLISNCDLSAENADCLDELIDSETYIAITELNLMRANHKHSLVEIATKKQSQHYRLEEEIALLEHENAELINKED